jgi:hypothetical protein
VHHRLHSRRRYYRLERKNGKVAGPANARRSTQPRQRPSLTGCAGDRDSPCVSQKWRTPLRFSRSSRRRRRGRLSFACSSIFPDRPDAGSAWGRSTASRAATTHRRSDRPAAGSAWRRTLATLSQPPSSDSVRMGAPRNVQALAGNAGQESF